eukprot:1837039-Lingulodinium_polyedra.AAC.1
MFSRRESARRAHVHLPPRQRSARRKRWPGREQGVLLSTVFLRQSSSAGSSCVACSKLPDCLAA